VRYLGIDYGKKRVGLALGEKGLAAPLLVCPNNKNIFNLIKEVCSNEAIDQVVLGFSQDLKEEVDRFAKRLEEQLALPIVFQNEALTTKEAVDKMLVSQTKKKDRKERVDAVAAAQILAAYFAENKD